MSRGLGDVYKRQDYTEQDIIERKKTIIEEFVQYLKDNELME